MCRVRHLCSHVAPRRFFRRRKMGWGGVLPVLVLSQSEKAAAMRETDLWVRFTGSFGSVARATPRMSDPF